MATIHHLHRGGSVRPIPDAELSRCMGDPDACFVRHDPLRTEDCIRLDLILTALIVVVIGMIVAGAF